MRALVASLVVALLGNSLFASTGSEVRSAAYQQDYAKWRKELDESRRKNWLTLVGLFWLRDGENRVGGDQKDEVPLPSTKAPAQIGVIDFHNGKAMFKSLPSAQVTVAGKRVQTVALQPDVTNHPTVLEIGDLRMHLIQREQKLGMRIKDLHSPELAAFKGTDFYPLAGNYIVKAKFIPYDQPKKVAIPTVLGQAAEMDSPGEVEFTLNGQKIRLQALTEGTPDLTFIIKDKTSGKATYPAGRFLDADAPKDGKVILDFNRAYSPPCAFTAYATCPLPPKQNWLPMAVEAGEKYSGHGH
ncbi:MAG: DUF1684 domain-containing protein [Terriglobales bacterium]